MNVINEMNVINRGAHSQLLLNLQPYFRIVCSPGIGYTVFVINSLSNMIIEKNQVVSLTYELRSPDAAGQVVEVADPKNPLTFLFGTGNMLEAFERNLNGLKVGDTFGFTLTSDEAYGPMDEEAIFDLPIETFMVDGKLAEEMVLPGSVVTMRDQNGYPVRGKVVSRSLETVKMDFNHPMAGQSLSFKGEIVEVRPATSEELAHGHVHGPGGHHH